MARKFYTVFFIILGLCILTIVLSITSFEYIELETAIDWTIKYFSLPIFILMIPSSYFIYLRFFRQNETKEFKSKVKTRFRSILRIFIFTLAMTGFFNWTTLSLIILTNGYIGDSKTINLNAEIVDYYTLTSKGGTRHYIKIQDKQFDRIIDLKVQGEYKVGQTFNTTMQIGKWGLLYLKK